MVKCFKNRPVGLHCHPHSVSTLHHTMPGLNITTGVIKTGEGESKNNLKTHAEYFTKSTTSADLALGLARLISVRKVFQGKICAIGRLLTSEGSIKYLPEKSTRSSNENTAYKAHLLCTNLIYLQKVASIK